MGKAEGQRSLPRWLETVGWQVQKRGTWRQRVRRVVGWRDRRMGKDRELKKDGELREQMNGYQRE